VFPFSIKGEVSNQAVGDANVADVVREIEEFLGNSGLADVSSASNQVRFKNNTMLMWSFRIYVMASGGSFSVISNGNRISVVYDIHIIRLLVISLFPVLFLSAVLFLAQNINFLDKLLIVVGIWLWLFGGNYVLMWVWTRAFLNRILLKFAPRQTSRPASAA